MAKVTIGGNDYEVGALNFKALKAIWPKIEAMVNNPQPTVEGGFEAVDTAIIVISAGMRRTHPEATEDWVEENLLASEIVGLQAALQEVLRESGLLRTVDPGEAKSPAKAKASRSTGTGTE